MMAKTEPPIRILHLSDFHFKGATDWDARPVLRALAAFIGQEVEGEGAPDLVAITMPGSPRIFTNPAKA